MLKPDYTSQFKKDLKNVQKRGFDIELLKDIIRRLCAEIPLDESNRDHALVGNRKGCRECHIKPDWLLIYQTDGNIIVFERTGSHSDLY